MSIVQRLRRLIPGGKASARPVLVVTDSTADLPAQLVDQLGITVVPLQIVFGQESFTDGVDLTSEAFFQRLQETDELPTTSQPSLGQFFQIYEALSERTDSILSIHLSSGFSGTLATAEQAAAAGGERCRIEVIDSTTVSMATGFAVLAAARAARDGADLDACAEIARSVLKRQRLAVMLDTLDYLRRGGRIGRAQAFLGGLLRLKPILTIRDGEASPLSRVRTRKKAMAELLRLCLDQGPIDEAAIMHATSPDDARMLADEIAARMPGLPVHIGRIGPVIGVHGGPGLIGIAVVASQEEAQADSSAEKAT